MTAFQEGGRRWAYTPSGVGTDIGYGWANERVWSRRGVLGRDSRKRGALDDAALLSCSFSLNLLSCDGTHAELNSAYQLDQHRTILQLPTLSLLDLSKRTMDLPSHATILVHLLSPLDVTHAEEHISSAYELLYLSGRASYLSPQRSRRTAALTLCSRTRLGIPTRGKSRTSTTLRT